MSSRPISVVIIDDHVVVREGTRQLLERHSDLEVIGEASSGEDGVRLVAERCPDVVLVDIHLPGMSGIAAARSIVAAHPGTRVLMLTAFGDRDYLDAALAAGATGFLLKTVPGDQLAEAVRAVAAASVVIDPSLDLPDRRPDAGEESSDPVPGITERELEIIGLVARGMTNKAIASQLNISRRTVEGHMSRVFSRVGVATRTELVRYALERHLVTMGRGG